MAGENDLSLLHLTASIVSAYVGNNPVPVSGLPDLISGVNAALSGVSQEVKLPEPELKPAVNPKRSVFPDYIISLEDGRKYKSLKRHLATSYGLTPDEYRAKWGLPKDYPIVAPSYSAARSALAKSLGLGRKPQDAAPKRKPRSSKS